MPGGTHREQMTDGTFEGLGAGRNGMIKIAVDVKNHRIDAARVLAQSESPFAQSGIDDMINRIIEAQSADVDAISGATLTTNGVKEAMKMAIDKSYGRTIEEVVYSDVHTDVVVIGAGGAGLSAAIEACVQGASVIVLEKRDYIGGNTNSSTGGINGAETSFQKALGIEDSKDPEKCLSPYKNGSDSAQLQIREPYTFEFLGLKPQDVVTESDLEDALINHLQDSLLEFGKGMCFEARRQSSGGTSPLHQEGKENGRIRQSRNGQQTLRLYLPAPATRRKHIGKFPAATT